MYLRHMYSIGTSHTIPLLHTHKHMCIRIGSQHKTKLKLHFDSYSSRRVQYIINNKGHTQEYKIKNTLERILDNLLKSKCLVIEGIDENIIRRLRGSFSPSIAWIYPKTNSDPIVLRAEREREREELYKQHMRNYLHIFVAIINSLVDWTKC